MACNIVAKDHSVIKYWINGKPQFIVERHTARRKADIAVSIIKRVTGCGNKWEDLYSAVDNVRDQHGQEMMTPGCESAINRLSY
jgi:hypothetical protein